MLSTLGFAPVAAGPAVNQFEVKDLESAPGDFEFQSQNAYSFGQPKRRGVTVAPGETVFDDNTVIKQREALELQLGVTEWFRVRLGIEYEQEALDDPRTFREAERFGSLKLDEVAVEGVLVFVPPRDNGIGLGLLMEFGAPVGERAATSEFYIGPIVEARSGPWSMIANLTLVRAFGGKPGFGEDDYIEDDKWDFAYFLQTQHRFSERLALALEAYGTVDRLGDSGRPSEARAFFGDHDQHRAGPVVYYTFFPTRSGGAAPVHSASEPVRLSDGDDDEGPREWAVSIGTGVLFGLNENTPDATLKLSLEVEY
ncbi:MAG: hypothetical protein ACRCS9_06435 [Hyphomicrobium sp.]